MKKIIAIDHGNRMMKSITQVFPASFVESGGHLMSIGGDSLVFDGKTYILTDESRYDGISKRR